MDNGSHTQVSFAELLRTYRMRRGATQRQLADLSTLSVRAIRNLENGTASRPRKDTVRLIADGLRLSAGERAALAAAGGRAGTGDVRLGHGDPLTRPPAAVSSLIGRDAERAALCDLLSAGSQRLVTISGIGGVGKTRVALAVADALHADHLPVLWRSADERWHRPGGTDRLSTLINTGLDELFAGRGVGDLPVLLADRPTLLVLDGYEPDRTRIDDVLALLAQCRSLRVLITSTRPYEHRNERIFPLPPLAVPADGVHSVATIAEVASVRLLVELVRAGSPGFAVTSANACDIAELCRLFDGVPAVLAGASSWLVIGDLPTLLDQVRGDPYGFVAAELAGHGVSLPRLLSTLDEREAAVLAALAALDRPWSMSEVVGLTGSASLTAIRVVRKLLLLGLVRVVGNTGGPGRSLFRALRFLRSFPRTATPGSSTN